MQIVYVQARSGFFVGTWRRMNTKGEELTVCQWCRATVRVLGRAQITADEAEWGEREPTIGLCAMCLDKIMRCETCKHRRAGSYQAHWVCAKNPPILHMDADGCDYGIFPPIPEPTQRCGAWECCPTLNDEELASYMPKQKGRSK